MRQSARLPDYQRALDRLARGLRTWPHQRPPARVRRPRRAVTRTAYGAAGDIDPRGTVRLGAVDGERARRRVVDDGLRTLLPVGPAHRQRHGPAQDHGRNRIGVVDPRDRRGEVRVCRDPPVAKVLGAAPPLLPAVRDRGHAVRGERDRDRTTADRRVVVDDRVHHLGPLCCAERHRQVGQVGDRLGDDAGLARRLDALGVRAAQLAVDHVAAWRSDRVPSASAAQVEVRARHGQREIVVSHDRTALFTSSPIASPARYCASASMPSSANQSGIG